MNKYILNGQSVRFEMVPHDTKKGYFILQLFVPPKPEDLKTDMAQEIAVVLQRRHETVISVKGGYTEIQLLNITPLKIVDLLRCNGFAISEQGI